MKFRSSVVNVKDSSRCVFPVCYWEIISSPFLHVIQALLIPLTKGNEETTRLQKPSQPDMRMLFCTKHCLFRLNNLL